MEETNQLIKAKEASREEKKKSSTKKKTGSSNSKGTSDIERE